MDPPNIKDGFIHLVLRGKMKKDAADKHAGTQRTRLPLTLIVMMLLKKLIRQWDKATIERLRVWAVCTLAFAGSFRIGEVIYRRERQFDPDFPLLTEDVTECLSGGNKILSIKLKCPKETKQQHQQLWMCLSAEDHSAQSYLAPDGEKEQCSARGNLSFPWSQGHR